MSVTVTMPQLGETVTEGTILSWAKEVGASVAEDEVLVEISTDKVDTEMPSPTTGVIVEILVDAGETVAVGTPIAVIEDSEESPAAAEAPSLDAKASEPAMGPTGTPGVGPTGSAETAPLTVPAQPSTPPDGSRRAVLSPVVRRLAAEHDIDLDVVPGTGDGGRITRRDVERYIAAAPVVVSEPDTAVASVPPTPAVAPISDGDNDETTELPRLRRTIAEHMIFAKRTAAHVWTSVEVDYERVVQARLAQREQFKGDEGFSLTFLPFIARATMDALTAFPVVNSSLDLDAGTRTDHRAVHLGIAVDLASQGLLVATVRDADGQTLKRLARNIHTMAEKTRDGAVTPDEITGSTFTITNPGPFGSFMSVPIINLPNVAILSTDTITKRPAVLSLPDGTDTIAVRHIGYLGLTWDHRAFDGSTAVLFLDRIRTNLETWDWDQELR